MEMHGRTASQKGNALEYAVKAIEQSILRMQPGAAGCDFTIECKKLIKVGGVPHEIDVYVTVHFGPKYQSIFIFECKNWAKPIDKNHIIIFSEKISASGAAQGYFVAKSFTAGARGQADKDKRVTLLTVEEHDPLLLAPNFSQSGMSCSPPVSISFKVTARDGSELGPGRPIEKDDLSVQVSYKGNLTTLEEVVTSIADDVVKKNFHKLSEIKQPGEHLASTQFVEEFSTGHLEILGKDIAKIEGTVAVKLFVYNEVIECSFDVATRGRVIQFKPVVHPGGGVSRSRILFTYK
jgi:hypothetical protein